MGRRQLLERRRARLVGRSGGLDVLAAAELIAAALGRAAESLPESATRWLAAHPNAFTKADAQRASEAAQRIGEESELQELWDEGGRADDWHSVVDDLVARLAGS